MRRTTQVGKTHCLTLARLRFFLNPPKGSGFAADLIKMAIDFLMLGLSLRQVEGVFNLMGQSFGFDAPDHTTVRLWALRMGLYLWQRTPPKASDWIWIVDHVAQASGGKCLFIVGVRHSVIQDGNFVLKHTDVALLYREVHCQRARVKVTRTPWAALSPTSTTSATRCDHFDTLVLWAQKTLARLDGGRIGLIDSTHMFRW